VPVPRDVCVPAACAGEPAARTEVTVALKDLGFCPCRSLDLTGPLLLGGVPNLPENFPVTHRDFVGCMRDLYIDSKRIDLASYIANNGTAAGIRALLWPAPALGAAPPAHAAALLGCNSVMAAQQALSSSPLENGASKSPEMSQSPPQLTFWECPLIPSAEPAELACRGDAR